ncbi:GNAT family N-acetyltransferase [Aurantiacibacter gangjinensis]|uniref:GCN5 family acetyltransferase n=1 Tax=Aurantiacibacter gangjinensis TaxID=502682 RepID=A0A0G9MR98_9SPHN|nr:N-acetyltransferase [Aurantiacibacter gangjinensis]APE29176.1 PhnO protein [Aurantiacibacter gangjinensis]KLE33242.1 GCN5 family acetyltransferase [Aurantiacibacter gangjinensis]
MDDAATLIPLTEVHPDMIEAVLDRAFGPDRTSRTAYKVREGTDWLPALSFAAVDDAQMLVGTIQVWPVALTDSDDRRHPMLMVGPVAVVPERQGEGFGMALMAAMTQALDPQAPLPQVMVGDPEYYGRFGFHAAPTQRWEMPGPFERHRLLVRAANPGVLPDRGTLGPWK